MLFINLLLRLIAPSKYKKTAHLKRHSTEALAQFTDVHPLPSLSPLIVQALLLFAQDLAILGGVRG